VDEADPIHLAASFAEHDLKYYVLDREEACLSCFVWRLYFFYYKYCECFLISRGIVYFQTGLHCLLRLQPLVGYLCRHPFQEI
jgi:hypothetical protein